MVRWLLQFIAIVLLLDGAVICMVSAGLPGRGKINMSYYVIECKVSRGNFVSGVTS